MTEASELPKRPVHELAEGPECDAANRLLKRVAGLPLRAIEHSIKLARGRFLGERFLIGIDPKLWDRLGLQTLPEDLGMPREMWEQFRAALPSANFLGLAFEQETDGCLYKAYVEFPVLIERHCYRPGLASRPAMIYIGFKWDPASVARQAITYYHWEPRLPAALIASRMARHISAIGHAPVRLLVESLFELAKGRIGGEAMIYLEAEEEKSRRRSFALSFYKAGINLGDIRAELLGVAEVLAFPRAPLEARLERDAAQDETQIERLDDIDHIRRHMRLVTAQRAEALRMRIFLERARTRLPRPLIQL